MTDALTTDGPVATRDEGVRGFLASNQGYAFVAAPRSRPRISQIATSFDRPSPGLLAPLRAKRLNIETNRFRNRTGDRHASGVPHGVW
jgi:hypothetical protein